MAFERLKEQIKEAPLSMVIGNYMTLNKKGANLEGICPFHSDTKPSLKVNDSKGMYKCFACGAGGDAITFVKEFKHLEYVETLKELANLLGLPFEEYQKEKKKNPKVEMAFRVLSASQKIYEKVASQKPLPYVEFIENRKLLPETIDKFQIGYAPGNNTLYHYLHSLPGADGQAALQIAQEIGIVRFNPDRNSHYDFYRDRVMFPVLDQSGQIRGYSSRSVMANQIPKYLNSGESIAFDKGSLLFALNFAKRVIREVDQVILVEGHMDTIMMHQFGFHQTVGAMGTAVSEQMIRILSNMTKNVFLALDSDAAGKKGMQKINAEFLSLGVLPKLLSFAPAKDPDEFLLTEGRLALMERIEKAPIMLDELISELIPNPIPENLELKLNALQRIFEVVSPLKENLSASERILSAAKTLRFNADSATILEQYKSYLSRQKEKTPMAQPKQNPLLEEEISLEESQKAQILQEQLQALELPPLTKSERLFLREIISHPEFLTHLNQDESLAYIDHDEVKKLVQWLVKIYREIDDAEYVSIVQEHLQASGYCKDVRDLGTEALFNHGNRLNEKVVVRMLKDYKARLKLDQLKTKRRILVERQKIEPSPAAIDLILSEISKLDKEIISLKP